MADEILAFGGFEAGEQDEAASTKGSSGMVTGIQKDASNPTAKINTASLMEGTYCLEVDPVNGGTLLETYGGQVSGFGNPKFLLIPFIWRFAAVFDQAITIAEYHRSASSSSRRIVLGTDEHVSIQDDDGDEIENGPSVLAVNTDYPMLWCIDLLGTTHDILWVWISGAWVKQVDVSGHGDIGIFTANMLVTFGSGSGKTLPTTGGPMFYDEWAIIENPTSSGLGSVATRYKKANSNGGDATFTDQAFGDVDDLPADLGTGAVDTGDAVGERNSYGLEIVSNNETPLAVVPVGSGEAASGFNLHKLYLFDGTTRDYTDDAGSLIGSMRQLHLSSGVAKTKMPDGSAFTETKFNDDLQVGVEIVTLGGSTFSLDQIGVEYMIAGARTQPSDFPTDVGTGEEVLGPIFIT